MVRAWLSVKKNHHLEALNTLLKVHTECEVDTSKQIPQWACFTVCHQVAWPACATSCGGQYNIVAVLITLSLKIIFVFPPIMDPTATIEDDNSHNKPTTKARINTYYAIRITLMYRLVSFCCTRPPRVLTFQGRRRRRGMRFTPTCINNDVCASDCRQYTAVDASWPEGPPLTFYSLYLRDYLVGLLSRLTWHIDTVTSGVQITPI